MLVLSRKAGEAISIADNITIRLVQVGNGRVRLGIEAPVEIPIRRTEVDPQQSDNSSRFQELESVCPA